MNFLMLKTITVIHEPSNAEPFVVLHKPRGLPSAPLKDGDESAYTQAELLFPSLRNVSGKKNVEHGLVHRIDTETEGLLLIASSQKFYDYMQNIQKKGLFFKTYKAVCDVKIREKEKLVEKGFPKDSHFIDLNDSDVDCVVKSYFRAYGLGRKQVRPVIDVSGRAAMKKASADVYETHVTGTFDVDRTVCNVTCSITKGYRHQVRCHLAWIGLPIKGDPIYSKLYNGHDESSDFYFTATGFGFPCIGGTEVRFSL